MTFKKLTQATLACAMLNLLAACGTMHDQIVTSIKTQVESDEPIIAQVQEALTEQVEFMDSFEQLLKDASRKYEKVEEVLPELKLEVESLKGTFETAQAQLALSKEQESKLEQLLKKAEKEEAYEELSAFVQSYQAYKLSVENVAIENVALMTVYEEFLSTITADMSFQELETLITDLNKTLQTVQESYDHYVEVANAFQSLLSKQLN